MFKNFTPNSEFMDAPKFEILNFDYEIEQSEIRIAYGAENIVRMP
jgi:hypothetical protein